MTAVVILAWDPQVRELTYVEVNDGLGGDRKTHTVSTESAEGISAELAVYELPRIVDLEIDGTFVMIDAAAGTDVVPCRVKAVGRPDDRQLELRRKSTRELVARLPATDLGINDPALAGTVEGLDFLYASQLRPPGCWVGCEGGIDAWLTRKRLEVEQDKLKRGSDKKFINPYTFVPFPERISRCEPPGHHRLEENNLSGTFVVTWEFFSPFQVPDGITGTSRLRLPGSSVKGAVRSLHEALAGGCLRVFDDEFTPSYRDTPTVRSADWTLAVVTEATKDGQPLTARLCDDVVWVRAAQLRQACGDSLQTGSRVALSESDVPEKANSLGRKELPAEAAVRTGGNWVVLVTDVGTRSVAKGTYSLACGRLGERQVEVTSTAWRAFRLAVAGANDLRRRVRQQTAIAPGDRRPMSPVRFGSEPIGRRRVVTGWLWPDDVIWTRVSGTVATELSLAAVWRHPGWGHDASESVDWQRWQAGNRVPADLRACSDPTSLCPSCRVFGSVDQNVRGRDRAEQRGYAGHVRFGDACSEDPVELEPVQRAPMGGPRPGAGQFYLTYDDTSPASSRHAKPTREWGSAPDIPETRRLRGRKFYWHADPRQQTPPRHIAREHQKSSRLAVDRWIAPAGTRLVQQIRFENLSEADLGGLLAAFEPQRVLPAGEGKNLLLHLGGGKPLGLGSCVASVGELRVWNAGSRYGGEPEISPDVAAFMAAFDDACPAEVKTTRIALAAVLAERTVDAARVWYPPGTYWSNRPGREKTFDEPFAFFTASSGMFLENPPERPLIPLPDPMAADQRLPIKRKADLE